jgi:RimJ/RimL family protein N-acetyltransferase
MKFLENINLEGERVSLIPLSHEVNIEELYLAAKNDDIWTYLPNKVRILNDLKKIVGESLKAKEQGLEYPFVVYDNELKTLVGSTRFLNISIPNKNLEIGWTWYSPEVWRTKVNTECKYLLLKYCFEELNLIRVQFKADIRNTRSNNAIQRIGAFREGELRQDRILNDGFRRNAYIYSIIDTEWSEVKKKLEEHLAR